MKKFILSILVFTLSLTSFSIDPDQALSTLQKNKVNISSVNSLKVLDKALSQNRVFLTGEYHGYKENYELRKLFMKYYHQKGEIKNYLGEMGFSAGYFLNKYINSGNTKYLKLAAYSAKGSHDFSKEDMRFWQDLYAYNRNFSRNNRVQVIGIDLEHQPWLVMFMVNDLLKGKNIPAQYREAVAKLNALCEEALSGDVNKRFANKMARLCKKREFAEKVDTFYRYAKKENQTTGLSALFRGKERFEFDFAIENLVKTLAIYKTKGNSGRFYANREEALIRNFNRVYRSGVYSGKFYGQFGRFHVSEGVAGNKKSFSRELKRRYGIKSLNIEYVYNNGVERKSRRNLFNKVANSSYSFINVSDVIDRQYNLNTTDLVVFIAKPKKVSSL